MAENHLGDHNTAFPVSDKETCKLINYGQLRRHPKYADTWNRSYANKTGLLCQGVETGYGGSGKRINGTDTFQVVCFEDTPKDLFKEVCYTSVVCGVRLGKKDPNHTHITICETNAS